jgi:hypothetical protein
LSCIPEITKDIVSHSWRLTDSQINSLPQMGVKDRPQEVKETLLLPRKCLFASERHLRLQAMQK